MCEHRQKLIEIFECGLRLAQNPTIHPAFVRVVASGAMDAMRRSNFRADISGHLEAAEAWADRQSKKRVEVSSN